MNNGGVVIFSPQTARSTRPIVIQHHGIPEVRLYPPEASDCDGQSDQAARRTPNDNNTDAKHASHCSSNSGEEHYLRQWAPFHMRPANLAAFPASVSSYRTSYRAQAVVIQRIQAGWISNTTKTLDIVRQNLQSVINKELDSIIRRYVDKFFTPAIDNIRRNNGEHSVSDEHIQIVCRQILDDAKRMYSVAFTRGSSPLGDCSDSEVANHGDVKPVSVGRKKSPSGRKRKDSDTDSEASQTVRPLKKKLGRPPLSLATGNSGRLTPSKQLKSNEPIKRDGPKWDPTRLTEDTLFVMGARANKALGFGLTRGRLYMKHPDIFKYGGDSEDKQWLYDNNLMPATGGKAYLLVLNDIKELAASEEYCNSSAVNVSGLSGFKVPTKILAKIKANMSLMRTEKTNASDTVYDPTPERPPIPVATLDTLSMDDTELPSVEDHTHGPRYSIEALALTSSTNDPVLMSGALSPAPLPITQGVGIASGNNDEGVVDEPEPTDTCPSSSLHNIME